LHVHSGAVRRDGVRGSHTISYDDHNTWNAGLVRLLGAATIGVLEDGAFHLALGLISIKIGGYAIDRNNHSGRVIASRLDVTIRDRVFIDINGSSWTRRNRLAVVSVSVRRDSVRGPSTISNDHFDTWNAGLAWLLDAITIGIQKHAADDETHRTRSRSATWSWLS